MTKRSLAFFLMVSLFAVITFTACGDKGGKGATPTPPPPSAPEAYMIWGQKVPFDMGKLPSEEQNIGEMVVKKPGLTEKYIGPNMLEPAEKEKVVAFFRAGLDGSNPKRMTPKGMSAVMLSDKPAPNGDVWFWLKPGIFVSNVNNPQPRLLITNDDLYKKLTDIPKGLFWFDSLINAEKNRNFSSSTVRFFPKGDGYIAVLKLGLSYIKADGGQEQSLDLLLRYDSADGSLRPAIPAMDKLSGVKFGENDAGYSFLSSVSWKESGLLYTLFFYNPGSNPANTFILVRYNPVEDKHFAIARYGNDDNLPADLWLQGLEDVKPLGDVMSEKVGTYIYQKVAKVPFDGGACREEYTPIGEPSNDPESIKAGMAVIDCMREKLNGANITLYKGHQMDITDKLTSAASFNELSSSLMPTGEMAKIADLSAGLFFTGSYAPNIPNTYVSCFYEDNKYFCRPSATEYVQEISLNLSGCYYNFGLDADVYPFYGVVKDGDKYFTSYNAIDISSGKTYQIASDNKESSVACAASDPGKIAMSGVKEAPVFLYQRKYVSDNNFRAMFAYDSSVEKQVQLTKYSPYKIYDTVFICSPGVGDKSCVDMTTDKKQMFLEVVDDESRENIYTRDVSVLFATGDEVTTSSLKTVGTKDETGAGATGGEGAVVGPLGEGWTAITETKHKTVYLSLTAYLDGYAIIRSNTDGKYKYYQVKLPDDLTQKLVTNTGVEEDMDKFVLMKGSSFTPPAAAIMVDVNGDVEQKFACGSGGASATYCANLQEVCIDGTCKNMFLCSADAPMGKCFGASEECKGGVCVEVCNANADCGAGMICNLQTGMCEAPPAVCQQDAQCPDNKKCVQGQCYAVDASGCIVNKQVFLNGKCIPKVLDIQVVEVNAPGGKSFNLSWTVLDTGNFVSGYLVFMTDIICANINESTIIPAADIYGGGLSPNNPLTYSLTPTQALKPGLNGYCFVVVPFVDGANQLQAFGKKSHSTQP